MKFIFFKFTRVFIVGLICAGFVFAQTVTETGIELYEKGEYEKSAESLQKAVSENEKDRQSQLYLGASLFKLKKKRKAAAAFEKAFVIPAPETKENEKPVKIISKPKAIYTDIARRNNVVGTIIVAVEFSADGEVNFVAPVRGLPDGLTDKVIVAAQKNKFEPATKDRKPVTTIGFLHYSFMMY